MWRLRYGSDPGIIGRTITVNRTEYVVVGVTPEGFRGHTSGLNDAYYQLWLPLSRHPRLGNGDAAGQSARFTRDAAWVRVVARLSEGATVAQADANIASVMAGLAVSHPATNQDKAGGVEPYFPPGARLRSQVSFARLMILGLSGMVLLVVGLNISGMMLVRSAMRERELAIRSAMGASRWRLMRYHLSEALVMALLGAGLGAASAPATGLLMSAVPMDKAGVGSAVNDTTREFGGALGIAVFGTIGGSAYRSSFGEAGARSAVDAGLDGVDGR